jgi:nucleoside-diphosphate-sugar epimerase
MRVFVAGATGVVGERLLPRLATLGHEVVASTRSEGKAARLATLGAQPVVMDGLDAMAVGEAIARAEPDVVIHQMTALAGATYGRNFDATFATTNLLRTAGTDHLLTAATAAGARMFIAQSYAGWPGARTGTTVKTEDDPLDDSPPSDQRETLAAIRHLERTVSAAPLTGIVLRYGSLYGPGASDVLCDPIRRRRIPVVGGGAGVWSFIHADDAAEATVAALVAGRPGIYNVVDDEPAPVAEWLPYLAQVIGARPPLRIPVWVGRLFAGESIISSMTRVRGCSNAKARRELGWKPQWASWRDGFKQAL